MIQLTRLNHQTIALNSDLIEHLESTPDTVITLTTGQKFMVLESFDDVVARVIAFRRQIYRELFTAPTWAEQPERSGDSGPGAAFAGSGNGS